VSAPAGAISIREFARRESCDDKLVRRALERGFLQAFDDGRLDPALVGTGWCERNRRRADKAADSSECPQPPASEALEPQSHGGALKRRRRQDDHAPVPEHALALVHSGGATLAEAERIKANALAHRALLATRKEAGELVEIEVAEAVFFETARTARDSWLNWPVRVGPLIAADLGLEADRVTEVLAAHVHQHLAELGEPEAEFADRSGRAVGS